MAYIGNGPYQGVLTGANIQDGTVETSDLANDAVTTVKINDGNVTTGKIADGAVTNAKIGASAVGTTEIADGAVTAAKIAAGAVETDKLKDSGGTTRVQATTSGANLTGADNTTTLNLSNTSGANYMQVQNGTSTGYFGVTGANDVALLGIDANSPVKIGTNGGVTRMTVTPDGKVGVGKTNPVAKLDILARGGTSFGTTSTVSDMSNGGYIRVQDDQNSVDNILAGIQFTAFNGDSVVAGTYDTTNGSSLLFGTESGGTLSEKMRIDSAGRVTMPYQPSFAAYDNRGLGTTSASGQISQYFTNAPDNVGSCYNTSNGRFTAPVSGRYMFGWNFFPFHTSVSTTSRMGIAVNGNGGSYPGVILGEQLAYTNTGSLLVHLTAGDYVEWHTQTSSSVYWYSSDPRHNRIWGYLIG
jgi:hypothetical protein